MVSQSRLAPRACLFSLPLLLCLGMSACSRGPSPFAVALVSITADRAVVRVTGFSSDELAAFGDTPLSEVEWARVLSVRVAGTKPDTTPAVLGRYRVNGDALEFAPLYQFDAGRKYDVIFDASRMPRPRVVPLVVTTVALPAVERTPTTTIVRMLPSADVLPENLLRVYLEFSAPMSRENGRDFITLVDEAGQEVKDAFLSIDVEFWSADYRRYTLLFDPGRVKRGILPNELFGRALRAGHRFTIRVDPRWRDANGQPLAAPFERTFRVSPADMAPMRLADWKLQTPKRSTRDPLLVTFPKPLDHGLLQRALGVDRRDGRVVEGDIEVGDAERSWSFTPRERWRAGQYVLVVMANLEDPAGNRIGRPFDVDSFEHVDRSSGPEKFAVPFDVR